MDLLAVDSLLAGYNGSVVLHGVSFSMRQGAFFALLGPNGAGKTTLLRAIAGLLRPAGGRILYNGQDVTNLDVTSRVRRGIMYQPDTRELFPGLSVRVNLELTVTAWGRKRSTSVPRAIEEVLAVFPELSSRLDQLVNSMSGGEQQMVALARCFVARPHLLLLDEPSLGLAPLLVERIGDALRTMCNEFGMDVLLAEQHTGIALDLADEICFLRNGSIALQGGRDELVGRDLTSYYLGTAPE